MKSEHFLKEGFVEDASEVHADHEVQMARSDLFHAAEDALVLHKLLRNVSEQQGLEGWVAAKITLASDYLKTVREYIEYELMTAASEQPMLPIAEDQQDVAEGSLNKNQEWDVYTVIQGNKADFKGSISAPDEKSAIQAVYNDPQTYGYVSRAYAWVPFVKPKGAPLPPDIGLIYDKIENSNLPTNTKNMLTSMITGNYPSGKDSPEQYYKTGKFSPKVQQYIDKINQQGVAEGAKWRKHPDAYDVDDEGNKTPRNPNSPKFGYDPLQRRVDTAGDAKTSKGKVAALKTSLKMAKGNKGVAEGSDEKQSFKVSYHNPKTRQDKVVKIKARNKDEVLDYCANKGYKNVHVKQDVSEDDSAVQAFLSKGGKIQQLPYKKPRKADKTDYGSKHIGGSGDKMKASRTGTAAKTQGNKVAGMSEGSACNHTMEGKSCPTHGLKECPGYKSSIEETTAGSVAGVVNPTPKNKAKVGTLFGGTYKQKKTKA